RDTPGANMLESPASAEKPAPAKADAKVEAKPAA
ncbi:MAG TPA: polymer-forming cytoskeletal protein, partial [Brevundimonas sp.]|nr:polymer-forming cytoskeletal protein [Brevundimonas sp.]